MPTAPAAQVVVAVVVAATAAQTIAAMGASTLPVIAPKLAGSLGIDPAWIGMQVSIAYRLMFGMLALFAVLGLATLAASSRARHAAGPPPSSAPTRVENKKCPCA